MYQARARVYVYGENGWNDSMQNMTGHDQAYTKGLTWCPMSQPEFGQDCPSEGTNEESQREGGGAG